VCFPFISTLVQICCTDYRLKHPPVLAGRQPRQPLEQAPEKRRIFVTHLYYRG